ncbi:MAG TPA: hypothetical protein PL033_05800 [Candidatus Brocadiia bacterium]|nr:hypothetical protein [Candidatus Brocadiia bacterium]
MSETTANRSEPAYIERGWYAVLEFPDKRARKMPEALEVASRNPTLQKMLDDEGNFFYRTIFYKDDAQTLADLIHAVRGWPKVRLYIRGIGADVAAASGLKCYCRQIEIRSNRYSPCCPLVEDGDSEVPGFIGCGHGKVWIAWTEADYFASYRKHWFAYGSIQGSVFSLDRKALDKDVATSAQFAALCPAFDAASFATLAARLPDTMPIGRRHGWLPTVGSSATAAYYSLNRETALIRPVSQEFYWDYMAQLFRGWRAALSRQKTQNVLQPESEEKNNAD